MDLDAFRWLLTDEGQQLLADASSAGSPGSEDELALQTELRTRASAAQVAVALMSYLGSLPFLFDVQINTVAFAISAIIGVVFGYFPARRAASLNPIDALRHE